MMEKLENIKTGQIYGGIYSSVKILILDEPTFDKTKRKYLIKVYSLTGKRFFKSFFYEDYKKYWKRIKI